MNSSEIYYYSLKLCTSRKAQPIVTNCKIKGDLNM